MNGNRDKEDTSSSGIAIGLCLGLSVGTAIGVASKNMGLWMSIGPAIGLTFGLLLGRRKDEGGGHGEADDAEGDADNSDKE